MINSCNKSNVEFHANFFTSWTLTDSIELSADNNCLLFYKRKSEAVRSTGPSTSRILPYARIQFMLPAECSVSLRLPIWWCFAKGLDRTMCGDACVRGKISCCTNVLSLTAVYISSRVKEESTLVKIHSILWTIFLTQHAFILFLIIFN